MKRVRGIAAASCLLCCIICKPPDAPDDISLCLPIDAVTCPTPPYFLRILGGETCTTHADIIWIWHWDNGELWGRNTQYLKWGTTKRYTDSIFLIPFTLDAPCTTRIGGLQPNTLYYVRISGYWDQDGFRWPPDSQVIEFEITTMADSIP